jgi:hypothetical protein
MRKPLKWFHDRGNLPRLDDCGSQTADALCGSV